MQIEGDVERARLVGFARTVIYAWALLGGFVLVAVVCVNAYSVLAAALINKPFPGDFELTEMGTAIAVFCFLPYCQLVGANVSADVFSMRAGPISRALMSIFSALVALLFSGLLVWRMSLGLVDYREYPEFTGILEIPIWWAYVPTVLSLILLFCAALIAYGQAIADFRKKAAR